MTTPASRLGGSALQVQEIVDRLAAVGVPRDEASAYVTLLTQGPTKASDLAAALGVPRPKAYRLVQGLAQRGFVASTLQRPMRFEASPPERLFEELFAAQSAHAQRLEVARRELVPVLSGLKAHDVAPGRAAVRVLQGRRDVYRAVERLVLGAKKSLLGISTHPAAVMMAEGAGVWDTILDRARHGLDVRGLLKTTPELRARVATQLAELPRWQLRHVDTSRMLRFIIADERDCIVWVVSDPSPSPVSGADVALAGDAPDFVSVHMALFEGLWSSGEDVRALPPAREERARRP